MNPEWLDKILLADCNSLVLVLLVGVVALLLDNLDKWELRMKRRRYDVEQ